MLEIDKKVDVATGVVTFSRKVEGKTFMASSEEALDIQTVKTYSLSDIEDIIIGEQIKVSNVLLNQALLAERSKPLLTLIKERIVRWIH